MIRQLKPVFLLYARNRLFCILLGTLIISGALSKWLIIRREYVAAEELWNILFVATLWVIFYLGVLMKQHIANHRASLLPGYRWPHIIAVLVLGVSLLLLGAWWNAGIIWEYHMTSDALQAGYICCVLMGVLILYLGYLSMGKVLLYAYGAAVMVALNVDPLIRMFESHPGLKYAAAVGAVIFLAAIVRRWVTLKADHFEYSAIFSWPPQGGMNRITPSGTGSRRRGVFALKNPFSQLKLYSAHAHFMGRVFHWDPPLKRNIQRTALAAALASPVYFLILNRFPDAGSFFARAYGNFLLLSLTPVLASIIGQYKKIAYWPYDLLRPVTRDQYLKERGLLLGLHLMGHWLLIVWFVALVPAMAFQADLLLSIKFWLYLSLTGLCGVLVLVWLAVLSCSDEPRVVIGNGIVLGLILLFFTYYTDQFGLIRMIVANGLVLAAVVLLARGAYYGWLRREGM